MPYKIPMVKRHCPVITAEEMLVPDPPFSIDYSDECWKNVHNLNQHVLCLTKQLGKIMHDMPHWTDDYIEPNSDNKFECFGEYDEIIGITDTKEQAKKILEEFFEKH